MKTIYVKDLGRKLWRDSKINWKKAVPAAAFLLAMFFLGRTAADTMRETSQTEGRGTGAEVLTELFGSELSAKAENWGLGFGKEGQKPTGNASASELARYNAYFCREGEEKVLYLTFDCGYENGNTEPILDALKKHNAPATFFVVGHFLETAPELVKRMVEDGHTVGNHTYHHPDMSKISDTESFRKEMDGVKNLFQEVTGTELAMYYRPPQGKYSTGNLQMAQEMGYSTFFWSLAYVDWNQDAQPSHEEAMKKLMGRVHPGAIVLLHSTSKTNGEILDQVLTKWEEMGYTFRPLSDFTEGTAGEEKPDGGQNNGDGGQKQEDGSRNTKDGGQNNEDGSRNTKDGGQNNGDGGRKQEDGGRILQDESSINKA